jgi:thiol-disulfide isomerase/thioredoxin
MQYVSTKVRFILVFSMLTFQSVSNVCADNESSDAKTKQHEAQHSAEHLIAQVDLLTKSMPERPQTNATNDDWREYRNACYIIQSNRINLLEILEKMGLPEIQIKPYTEMLIKDIGDCLRNFHAGWSTGKSISNGRLYALMDHGFPLTKTLATELFWERNIHYVNTHLMNMSENDMQTIASFELKRKASPEAGRLMTNAIYRGNLNKELKIKWKTWLLGNFPEDSEGHQIIIAKNRRIDGIGKPFAFESKDLHGNTITSNDYLGKVVLIDYWALWCGFCLQEIPNIKNLQSRFHDKGLRIVGVFNDCRLDALKDYIKENSIDWPQLITPKATKVISMHPLAQRYGITALPRYAIIGRDGNLIGMYVRVGHLESKIKELLQTKN